MQQLWESDSGLVVAANYLYLPLLFDPSIKQELETFSASGLSGNKTPACPLLIEVEGKLFLKTLNVKALLDHYELLQPDSYERAKRRWLDECGLGDIDQVDTPTPDPKLALILLQVMPYFLRRRKTLARAGPHQESLTEFLSKRLRVPQDYYDRADNSRALDSLRDKIATLEKFSLPYEPPPEGFISSPELGRWFNQALGRNLAAKEKARLEQLLSQQEQWGERLREQTALLLYLADLEFFEIDGCGFSRIGHRNEYRIYKRTGEYALKDFYGRPYLFPDCRVAVSTLGSLRPVVMEKYKHPMLHRFTSGQVICLPKEFKTPAQFTAANVIQALEAGINALYYGYNARRRNGSHSLDRISQVRIIDFDDYRIPSDHPKIVSGEVEIKNLFS